MVLRSDNGIHTIRHALGDGQLVEPQIELIGYARSSAEGRRVADKVVAVEGADLTVADGELFAILGPSGSGKTTVLRMIAGFEQPTVGVIKLGGVDVTALPPARRDINTVFQQYALFPHMTVAQNVEYGLRVRGVAKAERRRRGGEALEMVRLSGHASRRPAQLSGGQRQRVALARALVGRPRVLLLDEPLGALDLKLREQMQVELKAIQREVGITFVIVTHDQDEALTLCDRLAVFNDGRIEQVGAARDVYENPANRFVADFVGTSNVLDGAAAEALLGRRRHVRRAPRTHRWCSPPASAPPAGMRTVDATVAEVMYAGPTTRIAARHPGGVDTTATLLSAEAPGDLEHGAPMTLAWPDNAVTRPRHQTRGAADDRPRNDSSTNRSALAACARRCVPVRVACESDDGGGGGGGHATEDGALRRGGRRRGPAEPHRVGRLRRERLQRPAVDWVTPFEQKTGCKVNVKVGNTSDEMVQLMRTGQYDGVSASGDATLRLIYAGDVAPVNTDLVPNYADHLVVPQGQAVELRRRPDVRHPARLGREPVDVQHRRGQGRARLVGRGVRRRASTRARSPPTTRRSTSPTPRCTCRRPSPNWASRIRTR